MTLMPDLAKTTLGSHNPRPNIIVFLYDSLIPSMLSSFGGGAPTPAFDFFANGGVRFTKTASHSLRTEVAVGSILTGRYPHRNGVHRLALEKAALPTRQGYLHGCRDLLSVIFEEGYKVRAFNCSFLSGCMPDSARHNVPVQSPHVGQLMDFINESKPGPFFIFDRFSGTSFPWRPDLPYDRRESMEEHRRLALLALRSEATRPLIVRRMQDAAMREDRRLMSVINLLHRHLLMDNTIVFLSGIPGNANMEEMSALSEICGMEADSVPFFPAVLWYPHKIKPAYIRDSFIRHVDIMPTLLSLAGIAAQDGMDGEDLVKALDGGLSFPDETLAFYDERIVHEGAGERFTIKLEAGGSSARKPDARERSSRLYELLGKPSVLPRRNDALLKEYVIPKTSVFLVSLGRSGTQFFAKFFQRPEFYNVLCKGHLWPEFLNDASILLRRELVTNKQARAKIYEARREIMESPKEVFVCVPRDMVRALGLVAEIFPNSKFIFVTRDPRTAIPSWAGSPWALQAVTGNSLNPHVMLLPEEFGRGGDMQVSTSQWIEQVCKIWESFVKGYHKEILALGGRALVVRFEDIFAPERGFPGVKQIAEFVKDEFRIPTDRRWLDAVFAEKINTYPKSFPAWKDWGGKDKETLTRTCGEMMKVLGYDPDAEPK